MCLLYTHSSSNMLSSSKKQLSSIIILLHLEQCYLFSTALLNVHSMTVSMPQWSFCNQPCRQGSPLQNSFQRTLSSVKLCRITNWSSQLVIITVRMLQWSCLTRPQKARSLEVIYLLFEMFMLETIFVISVNIQLL